MELVWAQGLVTLWRLWSLLHGGWIPIRVACIANRARGYQVVVQGGALCLLDDSELHQVTDLVVEVPLCRVLGSTSA